MQTTTTPRGWDFAGGPTDDPRPSHLTAGQVIDLARSRGANVYELGPIMGRHTIRIGRGSFVRDFAAGDTGLFSASAIRNWLGV